MDPIILALCIILLVSFGGVGLLSIFRSKKKQIKPFQDNIEKINKIEQQINIDNQIQPVQKEFNIQQQQNINNSDKNLDKGFEYLEKLEMDYNNIMPSIEEKEKTAFQVEFEKMLDVKKIIDKQLDNIDNLIIEERNNNDHKDTLFFNINDIKKNVDEFNSVLNNLIKNAENEEIKLALEGKYKPYIKVYNYILDTTNNIIETTKNEDIIKQNQTIEKDINTGIIEQNIISKMIDGDNNYLSNLENDNNTMNNIQSWIDKKTKAIVNLGNRIIKSNNNLSHSPDSSDEDNNKNNNQANFSKLSLSAMLDELNKD